MHETVHWESDCKWHSNFLNTGGCGIGRKSQYKHIILPYNKSSYQVVNPEVRQAG